MHPDNNRQNALPTIFFKVFFKVLIKRTIIFMLIYSSLLEFV